MLPIDRLVPIPSAFHSSETGAPLDRCLVCGRELLASETEYLVEKAVRTLKPYEARDVIFEYAICLECYGSIEMSFSEASLVKVKNYFAQIDHGARLAMLAQLSGDDISKWISRCAIKSTPVAELSEYQMVALCRGSQMVVSHVPLVIGGEAMEEIVNLLSNETMDELNRFRDRFFDLPPGLKRDLRPVDFLFV